MHSVSFSNSLSLLTASVICMGIASGINHFLDGVSYEKNAKKERRDYHPHDTTFVLESTHGNDLTVRAMSESFITFLSMDEII